MSGEGSEQKCPVEGVSGSEREREGVCRDFLRGVCDRQRCKYRHEKTGGSSSSGAGDPPTLNFCHDYQNNSCPRPNCRFIHCTPAEEDQYKRTGELPLHLQLDAIRKHQLAFGSQPPVCKNFLNGDCRRGGSCKYRHMSRAEHENEIRRALKIGTADRQPPQAPPVEPDPSAAAASARMGYAALRRGGAPAFAAPFEFGPPDAKRRFIDGDGYGEPPPGELNGGYFGPQPTLARLADPRYLLLEEENALLHKQLAELKKQVCDLTATNEFLLDQNAQLRVSGKRAAGAVTSVAVPAVTITSTTAAQQMIRTVTASVAAVPVSLATVTAGNPVSMGAAVSMAPVPPAVSIAQPTILAAQQLGDMSAIAAAVQQQPQMACAALGAAAAAASSTSQAMAMSNAASQPMVSYPIMTQSVLQNGLPH